MKEYSRSRAMHIVLRVLHTFSILVIVAVLLLYGVYVGMTGREAQLLNGVESVKRLECRSNQVYVVFVDERGEFLHETPYACRAKEK